MQSTYYFRKFLFIMSLFFAGSFSISSFAQTRCENIFKSEAVQDYEKDLDFILRYDFNLVASREKVSRISSLAVTNKLSLEQMKLKLTYLLLGLKSYQHINGVSKRAFIPHRIHLGLLEVHLETHRPLVLLIEAFHENYNRIASSQDSDLWTQLSPADLALRQVKLSNGKIP